MDYILIEPLDSKEQCRVFLAVSKTDHNYYTLKFQTNSRPIEHEAGILKLMNSPHIVSFVELNRSEKGIPFLITEFVDGVTLEELINHLRIQPGAFNSFYLFNLFDQIISAVKYVHTFRDLTFGGGNQMVHGDLNPKNIIIGYDGIVRLIDFGGARQLGNLSGSSEKVTELTLRYSSPNQIHRHSLTVSDDIFALGLILWDMIMPTSYWKDLSPSEIIQITKNFSPRDPITENPSLSENLALIIRTCLTQEGFRGFHDINDLQKDWKEFLEPFSSAIEKPFPVRLKEAFSSKIAMDQRRRTEALKQSLKPPQWSWAREFLKMIRF